MAVEYIDPLFSITFLHFSQNFNLAQVRPLTIKFQSQETSQIKECTCIMLRKDWGLIISRHFWLPVSTRQLTQLIYKIFMQNAYEINSYNCIWALCNSIGKCKLQHWTDHFFVFQLIPKTEVIKQGKVSYKHRKLRFLPQSLHESSTSLSVAVKHPLQWFHHNQPNYHLH